MVRRVGGLVNTEQVRKHLRAKGQAHKCSPNTAFFLRIPAHAQETHAAQPHATKHQNFST